MNVGTALMSKAIEISAADSASTLTKLTSFSSGCLDSSSKTSVICLLASDQSAQKLTTDKDSLKIENDNKQ